MAKKLDRVLQLCAATVKVALHLWIGPVGSIGDPVLDLMSTKLNDKLAERQLMRFLNECEDIVARKLLGLRPAELGDLPENEQAAAVLAVHDTLEAADYRNINF